MKQVADILRSYTPLSSCQRATRTVQEAFLSATDYHDGTHYGSLTDLTGVAALTNIRRRMLRDPTGQWILTHKPRITDETLEGLEGMAEGTLGKNYFNFMSRYGFKPSGRPVVQFVPDVQLAYVSQRYKEIHDFLHVLLRDEVTVHNELVVKWFQMVQLGLPSAALAVFASPLLSDQLTLAETASVVRLAKSCKFVMNIHFEAEFEKPMEQLRKELMG